MGDEKFSHKRRRREKLFVREESGSMPLSLRKRRGFPASFLF